MLPLSFSINEYKAHKNPGKSVIGIILICATFWVLALNYSQVGAEFTKGRICKANQFRCKDGSRCIFHSWRCDGENDCKDGSDEKLCGNATTCTSREFLCNNQCVPLEWKCDGEKDCKPDGFDERGCAPVTCASTHFKCHNSSSCIPTIWLCDGERECEDGSDELNCDNFTCASHDFSCANGKKCISSRWVCDGENDCGDFSDEKNCKPRSCDSTEFKCPNGLCISKGWVCDGQNDCGDRSDEPPSCGQKPCEPSIEFQCHNGKCIHNKWKCDGADDCGDGSDEKGCPVSCGQNKWHCIGTTRCLEITRVCDGNNDCGDNSDEGFQCMNIDCESNNCSQLCQQTPKGAYCYCKPGYVLGNDSVTCQDFDECQDLGRCDHICINTEGSYKCKCHEDYIHIPPRTCRPKGPEIPMLIFANRKNIRRIAMDGKLYGEVQGNLTRAIAMDFDVRAGKLYWSDVTDNAIYRADYVTSGASNSRPEPIITTGLAVPDGLAVDWIGRNLYFVDSSANRIYVSKLNGSHRTSLITTNLAKPRGIALDPRDGFLFWTDWKAHRIERANMDGTNRTVLVKDNVYWVNALTLDYTMRTLYWADAHHDYVGAMSYYGQNRRKIIGRPDVAHPFAVTVFRNFLFFSDWIRHAIVKVDKFTGNQTAVLLKGLIQPMDIQVYHSARQPKAYNPCAVSNCGCQHLCLITTNQGCTCKCGTGYRLSSDGKSCININTFLLYARRIEIAGISLDSADNSDAIPPILSLGNAVGLDYDAQEGHVYFTDVIRDNISRISLSGKDLRVLITAVRNADGIAVDWLGRNLYWTDVDLHEVSVAKLNGSFKKTLFSENVNNPRAIVLHPLQGLMVWSDWGSPAKIEIAHMDGTERRDLVTGNGLTWPNGLAIDRRQLYWTDAKSDTISCIDLNGENHRILLRNLHHPFGLDVFEGHIFWTDWITKDIKRASLKTLSNVTVLRSNLPGLMEIKVYSGIRQQGSSPCSDGTSGCSHLCLLNPEGFSCDCPYGERLSEQDNRTCMFNFTVDTTRSCPPGKFRCRNDLCIPKRWKCDGENDCLDNSDEDEYANCSIGSSCKPGLFHCRDSKRCILLQWRCDGDYDCQLPDISDEMNCQKTSNCSANQFKCGDGQCKPKSWVCDGIDDCTDGSDEKYCGNHSCTSQQFTCSSGRCIPMRWRCDGDNDCGDRSDEIECPSKNCSVNHFRCNDGKCINAGWVCDGDSDCLDRSDETNCPTRSSNRCHEEEFKCTNNSRCIPDLFVCDFDNDCGDGSDERNCTLSKCKQTEMRCANKRCVPILWQCDGDDDCGDNTDEKNCGTVAPVCRRGQWQCSDNTQCISNKKVCDGKQDCTDGSDEGPGCALRGCRYLNGGCSQICIDIPSGVKCSCRIGFKLAADNKTCLDVDECKDVSTCSQQCYNMRGSFDCKCVEGYKLMADRRHCKAADNQLPYLYFSTRNEIHKIDIPLGKKYTFSALGLKDAIGLDFDWKEQRIYWSDLGKDTLNRCFFNGTGIELIISDGIYSPEGLAVDWIGRRLYWSDMRADRIEVATLDGKWRNVLISNDLRSPRGLVLDPRDGYLFWTDWSAIARIERSFLDGTNRIVLISKKIIWPNGLTLDFTTRRVYWIDAKLKQLEFCDYDGSNRHVLLSGSTNIQHPFSLSLFEDWVYWSDWSEKRVLRVDKTHGGNVSSIFRGVMKPMDIHTVHPLRQPEGINYCSNASCSHLCLLVPRGYVCRCPLGMTLNPDQTTCGANFTALIFATRNQVSGISIDPNMTTESILSVPQLNQAVAVDVEVSRGFFYWSDVKDGIISRVAINGSLRQTIIRGTPKPEGIAVDWIARNLYWTDYSRKSIHVARLDGSFAVVLITKAVSKPRAIAVHPVKALLFWSDWEKRAPRITRSNLDGSSRRNIVTSRLGYPNGLTIDYQGSLLYWCDAMKDVIEVATLDGYARRILYKSPALLHPFDITLYQDVLYFTDWKKKAILFAPKSGNGKVSVLRGGFPNIFGVQSYSKERQTGTNACGNSNGNCSQLCLATSPTTRRCVCEVGFKLNPDQKTCKGINSFVLYSTAKVIYGVSLNHTDNTPAMNPIQDMRSINSIDFLFKGGWIFFVYGRAIGRVNRDGTRKKTIISTGLQRPQGIAVDWVGKNLFWTDAGTDLIEVSRLNGSSRKVLISTGLTEPRSIVVYPNKGLLFWTDWGTPARIERASMDGSHRRTLVRASIIRRPSGLAIDYEQDMVYVVDLRKDTIWRMNLDGGDQKLIVNNLRQPSGLTLYGDHLYWTDRNKDIIQSANKSDGSDMQERKTAANPRDIRVFDAGRQAANGPCSKNGGCAELCLAVSSKEKRCACPSGRLAVDKQSCVNQSNLIIVADVDAIESLSINPGTKATSSLVISRFNGEYLQRDVDYDYDSETIFFIDPAGPITIKSVKIDGTDPRNVSQEIKSPAGLAIDWVTKHIYVVDGESKTISRMNLNGSSVRKVITRETRLTGSIALVPCEKMMYWIENSFKIMSAWMNGKEVKTVINTNSRLLYKITVDYTEGRLYWIGVDGIESSYLDGSNRHVVDSVRALSISIFGEFIYWNDWNHRAIIRGNKYNGADQVTVVRNKDDVYKILDMTVYARERQDCTIKPCVLNGGCSQICTAVNGNPVCSCHPGYLLVDGYRCVSTIASCPSNRFTCSNGKCVPHLAVCDSYDDCGDGSDELSKLCATWSCGPNQFSCNHGRCINANWVCDYEDDCGDGSDEIGCPPQSCAGHEFRCNNGRCKAYDLKCDGDNDCGDFSDEMGCPAVTCDAGKVKCGSKNICIHKSWMCDGNNDCGDNWDEQPAVCSNSTCASSQFHCANSRCIPSRWYCDGENDCGDMSDEPSSCKTPKTTCSSEKFTCTNGNCISKRFVCDGDDDCGDGSDESSGGSLCSKRYCSGTEFTCVKTSRCIPLSYMCDGDNDCGDASDESPSLSCIQSTCHSSQFRCANGLCIQNQWRCDFDDDCGDNSDEMSCANHTCGQDQFTCRSGHCISKKNVCDKKIDCIDRSDEDSALCSTTPPPTCAKGHFKCANNKCIKESLVCDKVDHCGDLSDERHCNINECLRTQNKVCAHFCNDTPTGFTCSCRPGYQLMDDGSSCRDIDECAKFSLNGCSQFCINQRGSYKCTCASGYYLEPGNRRTCKAIGRTNKPYIIFAERDEIRSMDINGWYKNIILNNTRALAVDFDLKERRVYWTQVGSNPLIGRARLDGTMVEVIVKDEENLVSPEGIAVDWVGRNLYFSDQVKDKIFVSTLAGKYMKTLVDKNLDEPRALVVVPDKGFLFYTDWGSFPHIGRVGLDGSSPSPIVHTKLRWPNGLTVCLITKKLFWADAKLNIIEYSNLDGSRRTQLTSSRVQHPFGLTLFEDFLYWTDWRDKTVNRAFKWTGNNHIVLLNSTFKLHGIQVVHPSRQPHSSHQCSKSPCNGLCLLTPSGSYKCACADNMHLANDGKTCLANCTNDEWRCNNYRCISRHWLCDGQNDCGDNSDERRNCPKRHCPPGTYQCTRSHKCISPLQVCNGQTDCPIGDDEQGCNALHCTSYQFRCNNRRCIYKSRVCDGVNDCKDSPTGSDEKNCIKVKCTEDQYKCVNTGRCIPKDWRCDGHNDCGDMSDEKICSKACPKGFFHCKIKHQCVPQNKTCDGVFDCDDKSDEDKTLCPEANCSRSSGFFACHDKKKCIPLKWTCDGEPDCADNSDEDLCKIRLKLPHQFRCRSGRLINTKWKCDGHDDCGDNSDEEGCGRISCGPGQFNCTVNNRCIQKGWTCDGKPDCVDAADERGCFSRYPNERTCPLSKYQCSNNACVNKLWLCDGQDDCGDGSDEIRILCKYHNCLSTQFRCKTFGYRCIPQWLRCDGHNDCFDSSDEKNCPQDSAGCQRNEFKCQNKKCIHSNMVCDGNDDCGDAMDEKFCPSGNRTCALNNGGCSQKCSAIGADVVCSCWTGFQYNPHAHKCEDINECLEFGTCEQECINTPGSYRCMCAQGYVSRTGNGTNCKAAGTSPVLLFQTGSTIRQLTVSPDKLGDYDTGVDDLISVGSLDVLASDNIVFWTDLTSRTMKRAKLPENNNRRIRRDVSPSSSSPVQKLSLPVGAADGVAVDWIGRNIFWTDSSKRVIDVATIDGLYRRTVVSTNLKDPGDIVVDANRGRMYWADRGFPPKIESANMDGTNRTSLVTEQLVYPSGLALDQPAQRLYWTDQKTSRVEAIGTNGQRRKVVWKNVDQPSSIAVHGDMLYVGSDRTGRVYRMNKRGKGSVEKIFNGLPRVTALRINQQQNQLILSDSGNPCAVNNGNCTHLCLATSTGAVCACPNNDHNDVQPCSSDVIDPRPPPACSLTVCGLGTCQDVGGKARCICPAGYTGPYCMSTTPSPSVTTTSKSTRPVTYAPDPCLTISCYNGGQCEVREGIARCKCPHGTAGANCEETCSSLHCNHGAECEITEHNIYCRCESGYRYTTGPGCENDPCINYTRCGQDGKCYVNGSTNTPYCRCKDGSLTVTCIKNPDVMGRHEESNSVIAKIMIPLVMVLLVIAVILVLLYCRRRGPMKPAHYCGMSVRVRNPSFLYEEMLDDNISVISHGSTYRESDKSTNFSNPVYESLAQTNSSSSTALLSDHDFISDFSWNNVDFTNPVYEALYGERRSSRTDSLFRTNSVNMNGDVPSSRESYA